MAFLACSRVSFSRKLRRMPMRKGPSSEHLLFHSRRRCGAEMSKGMENCSQNLGLLFGRNGIFQKAEGKGWKGLMERGIHRPRKGVSGEFFLGSSHWAAMGRSKRLQFCWQQLGGPRDSTIVFLSLFRLRKSHLVTERNTYIKCDDCNTFLVWKEGQIITHALPDLRSSEPKCRH